MAGAALNSLPFSRFSLRLLRTVGPDGNRPLCQGLGTWAAWQRRLCASAASAALKQDLLPSALETARACVVLHHDRCPISLLPPPLPLLAPSLLLRKPERAPGHAVASLSPGVPLL